MHRKVTTERVGVEDFIRLTPHRQNLQCSLISGIKNDGKYDVHMLDKAKENLVKSFSVVGICERFEESLVLIAKTFDWAIPFYENRKVAKTRPKVVPSEVDMIREHNQLDLELYEFGKKLFEEMVSKEKTEMEKGLATLKSIAKPGPWQSFCQSSIGAGRFLMSKIASAA